MSCSADPLPTPSTTATALLAIAGLIERREDPGGRHIIRVRDYALVIAGAYRALPDALDADAVTDEFLHRLRDIAPLHDIGKSVIPDAILLKPGSLTDREFSTMRSHTVAGATALAPLASASDPAMSDFFRDATALVRWHHENWDGSGYPDGLRGAAIPLMARIFAVADAYDALTSWRCYRAATSSERARHIVEKAAGHQFDPDVVRAFLSVSDRIDAVRRSTAVEMSASMEVGERPGS